MEKLRKANLTELYNKELAEYQRNMTKNTSHNSTGGISQN